MFLNNIPQHIQEFSEWLNPRSFTVSVLKFFFKNGMFKTIRKFWIQKFSKQSYQKFTGFFIEDFFLPIR